MTTRARTGLISIDVLELVNLRNVDTDEFEASVHFWLFTKSYQVNPLFFFNWNIPQMSHKMERVFLHANSIVRMKYSGGSSLFVSSYFCQ